MWTFIIAGGGITGLLILCFYLGGKLSDLKKEGEAKDEYIKRQTAILGAFVMAIKRGDDLARFIEDLDNATTPEQLNELYGKILSKTNAPNP